MSKIVGLIVLGLLVLGLAFIGILYVTRGTPVSSLRGIGAKDEPYAASDPRFVQTIQLLSGTMMVAGNSIEVLSNGDGTYPKLWEDLQSAKRSITLQMYYYEPGEMAEALKKILIERAQAKVRILVLVDAVGSSDMESEYFDSLRVAGIEVARFRPVHWYSLHKAQSRSHIRVVTVDGHVGYTGGFGIADKWYGDGRHDDQWRETNVRFSGPAVSQLQATFAAGWAEATGELLAGEGFFHPEQYHTDASRLSGLMHAAPTIGSTPAERYLALTLAGARKTLYVTSGYFVPDDDFRRLLVEAAKRGADVRILSASDKTDVPMTRFAGRANYEELLRGGVKVYEYQPTMVHAKTIVVDGIWSSIGTMNFDNRSMVFNDESVLMVHDIAIGKQMDAMFLEDLRFSEELKLESFLKRPLREKLRERGAVMLSRIL
ncbi:MAG: phosphatidylserine/phosphatidylglycerophosphate/cardiolipin synthase family protein [Gemmatimonadaceae bacterium]